MNKYEKEAAIFCAAVKEFSNKPENLENLENYLSQHFGEWLEKYANTPERITVEMHELARMDI